MKRNLALDRFRGMAVILMVAGNALSDMTDIPAFMRHTEDIGLSFADTIAPLFLFAIAASYRQSFLKHLRAFNAKAYLNYAYRYLALIGLGTIFSAGGALVSHETSWGVLQAIGMAGLLALPLLKFSPWVRLAAAGAMLAAYQLILDNFLLDAVLGSSHGGFFGSLAWGAMLILATVMLDFWQKGVRPFLAGSGALS
ncbi:MAG: DUF1624 domain-containing protein, partial [Clostridiales bacterium]|nr:DUF1624 domain-containing protein [Clostridiales bacterium]